LKDEVAPVQSTRKREGGEMERVRRSWIDRKARDREKDGEGYGKRT